MAGVTFLAPDTGAYVASVERHAAEFGERTGIPLRIEIVDSDSYFSNAIQDRLEAGSADVFMSGPVLLWEHVGAGLVEPLDEFVAQASDGWDGGDFIPALLDANRWTGRFGDPLGTGPLLEVPVNCESYNLSYVAEHLERHGLELPATWDAYFETAAALVQGSDGAVRGFGQRGKEAWHTMYTGLSTQIWSCGGRDFDDDLRCAIARPEVVGPTERFIAALHAAGAGLVDEQRWYELALDFGNGAYGLIVDSDHYVAIFEDTQLARFAGRIGYAPPPAGPGGALHPNLWTWSLGAELALAQQAGGLALHRVGFELRVPRAIGVRGEHEPDAHERLGRPGRARARLRVEGLRLRVTRARRATRPRARHAGGQLPRDRRSLGARVARRLHRGERGGRGARARGRRYR